ncbi:hypothetical protein DH2020_041323 [Rehmannia glutinosa]|uniref:Uncharacterized protein n=1 Tax=Rehmannia glutinosa TaxID=99300 RepID=A0ABR0URE8_REHGL
MLWPSRTKRYAGEVMASGAIVEEGYVYEEETHLTVLKTCLFFAGDGFTAYDSKGELVFRVDTYGPDAGDRGELVLMDAAGRCILTVRRKIFNNRTVEVYNPGEEYQIEGSFACRNCTILNTEKETVAEIRRKVDASTNVVLGKDVFVLSLKPGFDGAFAMGLVLVLDQIQGADDDDNIGENGSRVGVDPTNEDSHCSP